jgi:hypothetical protein
MPKKPQAVWHGIPQGQRPGWVLPSPCEIDVTISREGRNQTDATRAIITARSFHPGGDDALLQDGLVRFVSNALPTSVWQASGIRAGGELLANGWYKFINRGR